MNPHTRYPRDTDAENQWDPSSPVWGRVRSLFDAIPDGARVLDIGCNSGGFGRVLLERKPLCRVSGVDLAAHLLPLAHAKGYLDTHAGPAEDLSDLPYSHWDVVILSELLEHADDPNACLREAWLRLKYGGLLLGDVPTWFGWWGFRSLRHHKWHQTAFTRYRLRRLLKRYFRDVTIHYAWASWRAGYLLPQWETFACRK